MKIIRKLVGRTFDKRDERRERIVLVYGKYNSIDIGDVEKNGKDKKIFDEL